MINDKISILILTLSLAFIACQEKVPKPSLIENLTTIEKRNNFLDSIIEIDQKVREDISLAQQQFGYESKEHLGARRRLHVVDSSNFKLIDEYLQIHGYPSKTDFKGEGQLAPWLVLHHVSNGHPEGYRHRNMPVLVQAWQNGELDDRRFAFFLGRMYQFSFGETFTWEGTMTTEREVDTLLRILKYDHLLKVN